MGSTIKLMEKIDVKATIDVDPEAFIEGLFSTPAEITHPSKGAELVHNPQMSNSSFKVGYHVGMLLAMENTKVKSLEGAAHV